jgi:hypothetical protein
VARLWDRLDWGAGGPAVGTAGVGLEEIAGRLEAGESPAEIVATPGIDPADWLAAVAGIGLGPSDALGPTLIRSEPRSPALVAALGEQTLGTLWPEVARPDRLALAAGLLQIHDAWEASHEAAQQADDLGERQVSAYWHGIAHRREPDPGNATYWFRRVGRHPVFEPLAAAARPLLAAAEVDVGRLGRTSAWDPLAFIEFCQNVRPGAPAADLARRLQRIEMLLLLDATADGLGIA